MKIALIPPVSQVTRCMGRPYQMMLPTFAPLSGYSRFYLECWTTSYVMLDNGAFEGHTTPYAELLTMADTFNVDEVIAPDVIGDADKSYEELTRFLVYRRHPIWRDKREAKVAAVIQGKSVSECNAYVEHVVFNFGHEIATLCVPKHLPETTGELDARIQVLRYIQKYYKDVYDVHFLGFNTPGETMEAAGMGVRSMDTTAPFVCAYENVLLRDGQAEWSDGTGGSWVPPRPHWYENLPVEYFHPKVIGANIDTLDKWADYKEES